MPVRRLGAITADSYFLVRWGVKPTLARYQSFVLDPLARLANVECPPPSEVAVDVEPLRAFLSGDRWIVGCPDCAAGFELVFESEPLFMCAVCWNARVDGLWRPVVMPPAEIRAAVEAAAGEVSLPGERHWIPGRAIAEIADPEVSLVIGSPAELATSVASAPEWIPAPTDSRNPAEGEA